ncbi:MAG TPA: mechanosensitive ion channel domain-containing protein [Stellaceae bacterium]
MVRKLVFWLVLASAMAPALATYGQTPPGLGTHPASPPARPASAATAPTPAEAQQTLDTLQDPKKLQALIQTLQTIAKANPAQPGTSNTAPTAKPAPATPATASALALAPDSLGAQLLPQVTGWTGRIAGAAAATVREVSQAPTLWHAMVRAARNPDERLAAADALWRIALALVCAAIGEFIVRWILRRPLKSLEAHATWPDRERNAWDTLRRLPYALARLVLWLIPLAVFAAIGNVVAGLLGGAEATPLVAVALVNAYVMGWAIVCVAHMLFAPYLPPLRLVPLDDAGALSIMRWFRRITFVAVFGSALAEILLLLGLPTRTHDAVIRLTGLVAAIMLGIVVIHCRKAGAARIRGTDGGTKRIAEWRRWFAETWHYLAIAAIVTAWLVAVGGVEHRLDTLDFLLGTVAVLVGARLLAIVALGALTRALPRAVSPQDAASAGLTARVAHYNRIIRIVVISVITAFAAVILLQLWGVHSLAWFEPGHVGQHLVSALITIALAAGFAIVVWESVNAALDREIDRLHDYEPARSARLRTLLPVVRTAILIMIVIIIGATALSEIGVNIAPLLAGAGIVGVAVGFGSQTLVHDIITGMFILIENTIQVGDGVTVAGLTGKVEDLSIRTLRLRAADGALHIIPFSSIATITNTNRGIGNATVAVTVAPDQDLDHVSAALTEIGAELRKDAAFAPMILGDLDLYGVDAVTATAVTIAGKIPCTVSGKLPVQREFNRRMVQRFAKEHIALAA